VTLSEDKKLEILVGYPADKIKLSYSMILIHLCNSEFEFGAPRLRLAIISDERPISDFQDR
jgi:hypothetical protein